ncbi:MAG: stage II sporulation protein M [Firmicutes bacterium]|nr:stage II sporulation protein M [Bacillota bacterium]
MYTSRPRFELIAPYRSYLIAATVLFTIGIVLGVMAVIYYPEVIQEILAAVEEQLKQLGQDIFAGTLASGIWTLFLHNLRAVAVMAALGLLLGAYPVFTLLVNGAVIGVTGVLFTQQASLAGFLAGIIPHGIFEIPALLLGASLGLRLGLAPLFNRNKSPFIPPKPNAWRGYRRELLQGIGIMIMCVGLLGIAAVIEVAITPKVMALFGAGI